MSRNASRCLGYFIAILAVACFMFSKVLAGFVLLFFALPFAFPIIGGVYVFVTLTVLERVIGIKAANAINAFCHKWLGFGA